MRSFLTVALGLTSAVTAYPGMRNTVRDIRARATEDDSLDSKELIGDLLTVPAGGLTPIGKAIKEIITADGDPESNDIYDPRKVPSKGTPKCQADTCCIWHHIANDMEKKFRGKSGRCTALARGAVRLGFHDCGAWSKTTGPGGCDGSILLSGIEMGRGENRGLEEIAQQTQIWYDNYKGYGITMADLIQMGANVATVVCPLGPRIRSYVGRVDSRRAAPGDLLPPVTGSADFLIKMFQNKTIEPHGLTALIGAHTTSQQRFVEPSRALDPQDSTPGVWDVLFYKQTLSNAPARVFKFASDVVLSKDSRIKKEFEEFAGPGGQEHWNEDYAREYIRLSLLGVNNINQLVECTKALPPAIRGNNYRAKDQDLVDKWVQTKEKIKLFGETLESGDLVSGFTDLIAKALKGLKLFSW